MNTELITKAEEFGLSVEKGNEIIQSFSGKFTELKTYKTMYNELLEKELTPEVIKEASELKKLLSKSRISSEKIREAQKKMFLNGGRFVDSQGNYLKVEFQEMERVLDDIVNKEKKERQAKEKALEQERLAICEQYGISTLGLELGKLPNEVWESHFKIHKEEWDRKQDLLLIEQNRDKTKLHILSLSLTELLEYDLLDDELEPMFISRIAELKSAFNKEQYNKSSIADVDFTYFNPDERLGLEQHFKDKSIKDEVVHINTLNLKDLETYFVINAENKELKETRFNDLVSNHYNEQLFKSSVDKVDFSFLNEVQVMVIKDHYKKKQDEADERAMSATLAKVSELINSGGEVFFDDYRNSVSGNFKTAFDTSLNKLEETYNNNLKEKEKRKFEIKTLCEKLYKPTYQGNMFVLDLNSVKCIEIKNIDIHKVDKFNERQKQIEADRLKSLGEKEQLLSWVNSFKINDAPINNELTEDIQSKFNSFVAWAKNQINK